MRVFLGGCWVGGGGLLINSNAGYAELNWEKSPGYNFKRVSFPTGGWAVDSLISFFTWNFESRDHYSNLPLTLA